MLGTEARLLSVTAAEAFAGGRSAAGRSPQQEGMRSCTQALASFPGWPARAGPLDRFGRRRVFTGSVASWRPLAASFSWEPMSHSTSVSSPLPCGWTPREVRARAGPV